MNVKRQINFKPGQGRAIALFAMLVIALAAILYSSAPAQAQASYRYVGSFMNKANRSLKIIVSNDGLNFTTLYDGGFKGIGVTLRDPSIMKHSDGKYYVAYTATNTQSCCDPENRFGIAVSSDLVNWSNHAIVTPGIAGTINTWAPEWYVDSDGSINILVSINTTANNYTTYRMTAQNSSLTSFSAPVAIMGPNVIDTIIVKVGSVYHAFPKNATTQYIEHATGPSMNGPWTYVGTGNWAGWSTHREGPTLIKLDNGKWRMYIDTYATAGYLYSDGNSDFTGWTVPAALPGIATTLQHGTVIDLGTGGNPTPTRTNTPVGPTPTRTYTPNGPTLTPTRTPTPGSGTVTYQAENAVVGGGTLIESNNAGFNGTGFANLPTSGGFVEYQNADGGAGGSKTLQFRFALGASGSRTGQLIVNGVSQNITFNPTGAWTTWSTLNVVVSLNAGTSNTVRLQSNGQDLANQDQLTIN